MRFGLDGARDEREQFEAVPEIPQLVSARKAVQVEIVKNVKGKK